MLHPPKRYRSDSDSQPREQHSATAATPSLWSYFVRRVRLAARGSVTGVEPGRPGRRTASTWRAPGRRADASSSGRAGLHVDPAGVEEAGRVGPGEDLVQRAVEGVDHVGGRLGRSEDPVPLGHVHAVDPGLVQRRNARQHGDALRTGERQGTEPSAGDPRVRGEQAREHQLGPACDDVAERRRGSAEGEARDVDAGGELEQLRGEVRCGPLAGGGVGVRLRVCLAGT